MNNTTNYRIFVEKLPRFRVEAESLRRELNTNLNLSLGEVRLLCVYDLFGFSEELLEKSRYTVFGEVVTDSVTDTFDLAGRKYIAVEYLPGQFDQRAASAVDCVRLIDPEARVDIRSSRLLVFDDKTTDGELAKIRHYYINAVESREKDLSVLSDMEQAEVKPVGALEGFREMADSELEPYCKTMGLAMNADDLREVVKYFRSEGRDPYETELRILDTYWSDHCRHTTFTTELEGITVEESFVKEEIEDSLALYLRIRRELGREHKSEVEMKEKKDRVEDALNATRAAVEEGIVPGGGTALIRVSKVLDSIKPADDDELAGVNIIRNAIEAPLRQIAHNAGFEGSIVVEKVRQGKDGFGFNAATGEYEDLIKAGVIDPKKVTRTALLNAASVASLLLTTECAISEKPEPKKDAPAMPDGMGGMGGMGGMY